jgi:hypothetical protein
MTFADKDKRSVDDMGAQCVSCAGGSFRRSRLKVGDIWSLLVLRYPVRCLACSKRQTVSLAVAARAASSKTKQVRARHGSEAADNGVPVQRPSVVGGDAEWAIPMHEPMVMPDLHGVALEHVSSLPLSEETSIQKG